MRFYFLRHAKTEKFSRTGKDFDRSLAPKGIEQATLLMQHMAEFPIQTVHCSTAVRTMETLNLLNLKKPKIVFADSLYLASRDAWISYLTEHISDQALFVGHNEGLSEIVSWLVNQDIHLQTGALVTLDFQGASREEFSAGLSSLISYFRPEVFL